jgi:CubicO group peptidase (beta-lactamase class C family)
MTTLIRANNLGEGKTYPTIAGFVKPSAEYSFGNPESFGTPGAGGSFGFADPQAKVGYAYVMNRMSTEQGGDAREVALRQAMFRSINK